MISETIHISSTGRFSDRAENYARSRPGYPDEVFSFIENKMKLEEDPTIVDIGSGTGLFAEPLLKHGYRVVCIEPNDDMRRVGSGRLEQYPLFESIGSTAEETGLDENSTDLITVAQAFHWLDTTAAREEWQRILKPNGKVILAWNRQTNDTEFETKYTELRERYRIGEPIVAHINKNLIAEFFAPIVPEKKIFANTQSLDFEGLKGQLLSKSYIPLPGHPRYDDMITELIQMFVAYNSRGLVTVNFETVVYCGELTTRLS